MSPRKVAWMYFRTWFPVDVASSIPFGLLDYIGSGNSSNLQVFHVNAFHLFVAPTNIRVISIVNCVADILGVSSS
jgi:hypothetical protein